MSRRSNLNTVRKSFSWDSSWTISNPYYIQVVWFDIKITAFLSSLFYVLRLPTSNYVLRRFMNSFVIIETDVWIFRRFIFAHCIPNKYYFMYVTSKLYKLFRLARKHKHSLLHYLSTRQQTMLGIVFYFLNRRRLRKRFKQTRVSSKVHNKHKYDYNNFEVLNNHKRKYNARKWSLSTLYKNGHRYRQPQRKRARARSAVQRKRASARSAVKRQTYKTVRNSLTTFLSSRRLWKMRKLVRRSIRNTRYLFFSRTFYYSAFRRLYRRLVLSHAKWASLRKHHWLYNDKFRSVLTSDSLILAAWFTKYDVFFKSCFTNVRLAYMLRSKWQITLAFRLFLFYHRYAIRHSIFTNFNRQLVLSHTLPSTPPVVSRQRSPSMHGSVVFRCNNILFSLDAKVTRIRHKRKRWSDVERDIEAEIDAELAEAARLLAERANRDYVTRLLDFFSFVRRSVSALVKYWDYSPAVVSKVAYQVFPDRQKIMEARAKEKAKAKARAKCLRKPQNNGKKLNPLNWVNAEGFSLSWTLKFDCDNKRKYPLRISCVRGLILNYPRRRPIPTKYRTPSLWLGLKVKYPTLFTKRALCALKLNHWQFTKLLLEEGNLVRRYNREIRKFKKAYERCLPMLVLAHRTAEVTMNYVDRHGLYNELDETDPVYGDFWFGFYEYVDQLPVSFVDYAHMEELYYFRVFFILFHIKLLEKHVKRAQKRCTALEYAIKKRKLLPVLLIKEK